MNGKNMTDVIAEIRKRAENAHDAWLNDPDETVHHEAVSGMLLHIAEKVEAAWKRDTEHLEAFAVETHRKQFTEMRGEIERLLGICVRICETLESCKFMPPRWMAKDIYNLATEASKGENA